MLEISHDIVQQIANMPTEHSWAVSFMKLPAELADEAESLVLEWIEQEVNKLFPYSERAERIVRTVWLHMLEAPAVEMWVDQNPSRGRNIPVIIGAEQGAIYGAMDIMYSSQKEIKTAERFLSLMNEGKIRPNVDNIMQKVLSHIKYEDCHPQLDRLHGATALMYWYGGNCIDLMSSTTKLGYAILLKGICTFSGWSKMLHYYLVEKDVPRLPLMQEQVEEFICDVWNYPYTVKGETLTIREWASILKTRNS